MYQLFIIDIYLIDRKRKCRNIEEKKIHSFKMEIYCFNTHPYPHTRMKMLCIITHTLTARSRQARPQNQHLMSTIKKIIFHRVTFKKQRAKNIVFIHYHKCMLGKNKQKAEAIF